MTQDMQGSVSILNEAYAVIYGDREHTYGNPAKNLKVIADMWSAYLEKLVNVEDVANLMILLKVARLKNTPDHRDSLVDICGYAALTERVQNHFKASNLVQGVQRNDPLDKIVQAYKESII